MFAIRLALKKTQWKSLTGVATGPTITIVCRMGRATTDSGQMMGELHTYSRMLKAIMITRLWQWAARSDMTTL